MSTDNFSDFGSDAEETEILNQLVTDVENAQLTITDIEDYEPPRGVRLPKNIGFETRPIEILRDPSTQTGKKDASLLIRNADLTSD